MRTLFITDFVPYPLTSGIRQRVYHLLKAVAAVSEVTFVASAPGMQEETFRLAGIRRFCKEICLVPSESSGWWRDSHLGPVGSRVKGLLRYCHPTEPIYLQVRESKRARELIHEISSQGFDLVWAEGVWNARKLPSHLSRRVVVDLNDLEDRKLAWKLRNTGVYPRMALDCVEYLKWRRVQKQLIHSPYELVVCSQTDRRALGGARTVWVVPNGVELPPPASPQAAPGCSDDAVILFLGAMFYAPNIDAVRFFLREVFPLIRREAPAARLLIVGRAPVPEVRKLHDGRSVLVTGEVPDVAPHYHQATIVITPIRYGGGTRIKILEALAHAKAVVSTSAGAEGLDVEPGRHLLIADSPSQFAQACLKLIRNPSLRRKLGDEGLNLVRDKYQWTSIERRVQEIALSHGVPHEGDGEPRLHNRRQSA